MWCQQFFSTFSFLSMPFPDPVFLLSFDLALHSFSPLRTVPAVCSCMPLAISCLCLPGTAFPGATHLQPFFLSSFDLFVCSPFFLSVPIPSYLFLFLPIYSYYLLFFSYLFPIIFPYSYYFLFYSLYKTAAGEGGDIYIGDDYWGIVGVCS